VEHLRRAGHHRHAHRVLSRGVRQQDLDVPQCGLRLVPAVQPGLVSIPASFLLGYLGSVWSKEHLEYKAAEMEVRSITGAGAEGKALDH
jgi:hypothetical protein